MATVQQANDTTITTVATLDSTEESLQQPIVIETGARMYYKKSLMFLLEKQVRGDINPKSEMFYWETFLRRDWPRVQINIWARSSGTLESR